MFSKKWPNRTMMNGDQHWKRLNLLWNLRRRSTNQSWICMRLERKTTIPISATSLNLTSWLNKWMMQRRRVTWSPNWRTLDPAWVCIFWTKNLNNRFDENMVTGHEWPMNEINTIYTEIKSLLYFQRRNFSQPSISFRIRSSTLDHHKLWTSSIASFTSDWSLLRLVKCNNRRILPASFRTGFIFLSVIPKSWSILKIYFNRLDYHVGRIFLFSSQYLRFQ